MKNRVLSVLISIGIILSNFSTGFAVIAKDGIGTTDPINSTTENTEQEEQTEPSEDVVTRLTDKDTNIEPSGEQNGETVDVKIVLKKEAIYYGQDLPFDDEGNVNSDYYYFVDSNTEKEVESIALDSAISLKAVLTEGQVASNNYANYQINVISDASSIVDGETVYNIVSESLYFAVNGYYSPDNVEVISYIENGVLYIRSNNNQYAVGIDSDASSFSESSQDAIAVSDLEGVNGVYTYYLRNINNSEGNVDYHAISSSRQISIEDEMELSQEALVSDIIFSQIDSIANYNAYNKSITITVTGKAKSDSADIAILNNGVKLYSGNAKKIGTENGKNIFSVSYTFELSDENPTIKITNLTAQLSVNGKSISSSLLLIDSNRNTKNDFLLENTKPDVVVLKTEKNYTHIRVTDNQSKLSEVYYRIENGEWTKPTTEWIQQLNQQNPNFQSGVFSDYSFYIYTGKKGHNGNDSVEIKVIDCAGNERIYPNSTEEELVIPQDGSYPVIDSVTILDGKLNSYAYGNYINQDIRLKITAHDVGHKTDNDHGIKDIWISDSETRLSNKANIEYIKTEDPDTGDLIKTAEIDYYYFELPIGTDIKNLIINVRDDGRNITSESLGTCINVASSYLRIEDTDPIVDIQRPTYSNSPDMDSSLSNNWYGFEQMDDTISISFGDWTSGIAQIVILDNGVVIDNLLTYQSESNKFTPNTMTKNSIKYLDYTSLPQSVTDLEFVIPIKIFTDGEHVLSVIGIDNAGNKIVSKNGDFHINNSKVESGVLKFSTDFKRPTGTVNFVTEPKEIEIDGETQNWFNGCGAESEKVVFTLAISDTNPYKVEYSFVNSESQNVYNSELLYITSDGTKIYSVEIDDADAKIELEQKHYLDVYVTFVDQAGNTSTYDDEEGHHEIAPIRFHKDFSYPKINKVTVSKTETGFDKVLRVLTFGIYSNNNIKYTVNASDIPNDSGLADDSVLIAFGGLQYEMARDNDVYSYVINVGDEKVLSGEITISVTDRYGLKSNRTVHYSEDFDVINGTSEEPYFTIGKDHADPNKFGFMIDKNRPIVEFETLISDGQERTDNTIWFKDDHDVKFTVSDADSGISSIIVIVNGDESNPLTKDSDGLDFLTEQETSNYSTIDEVKKTVSYRLSTDSLMTSFPAEDGHYVIEVVVTDYAGNVNETSTIDYYIDKIIPKVGSIDFSIPSADNYTDAADFIDILEYGFYFKTDLIATVNITDDEPSSGLYNIEYNLIEYNNGVRDSENLGTARIENGKASFTIPANFKGQIFVKGYDYVGNVSNEVTPQSFVVDTPEKHVSEEHIEITGMGTSAYADDEGHPLFDANVNLTVRINDTMSGIRDISYSISSEQDTQDVKTITINNTGNSVGQNIGDGWTITAMDENLVTEVTRNYTFSADNNNIQLSFAMTDRANNSSDKTSDIFSIDQTAPIINVTFDSPSGNNDYYRENRTATITVIERNFDSSRITATITNEIGNVPVLSFTSNSKTEHVAVLIFGEGDYTFGIEGSDRTNHTATVNYSGGNERSFHVDMTNPTEIDNFEQFINELNNSFNIDKEMTITITEHNFVATLVNIRVYRTAAGNELTTENREDCTAEYVSVDKWNSNGDTHSISFTFSADYVYQVTLSAADASGRTLTEKASPVFEIDKIVPVLKTPTNLDVLVFTSKNTETTATPLEFFDANIASIHYSVVSYQMKLNEDNVGYDMDVDSDEFDVKSDSVVISNEFFNQDGIYEVKSVAYDVAGNASNETTHTFVIQRYTDFLVYIPNSNKENQTGLYKFNEKGIRSADFEDIEIVTYITQDKEFEVQVDGKIVDDADLDISKDDRKINQVNMYDVTLKNSYISQNYDADTIDTDLTLNAVAKSDSVSQVITLGHIYIDNVKPMGEYEKSLQDIGVFDGYYGVESKTVMIEGVSPDIDVNRCEIQANNETLTFENGGFQYDENAHTISFTLNKGYTDIRPTLVDNAGNINNLEIIKNVYVGNLFVRWWYLFILGGLIVLAIPTIFIIMIVRKKRAII